MATTTQRTQRELISLKVPNALHVIGEAIEGEVLLDFLELQNTQIKELLVKLRGSVFTRIKRQQGKNAVTKRETVDLIRQDLSLWTSGSAYPQAGTHILTLPFRLTLNPSQPLPSACYDAYRQNANVVYSIETVGVRTGLHFNKRVSLPLSVLPPNMNGASLSQQLRSGVVPSWRNVEFKKDVRRGIWGEHSKVHAILTLPDIQEFPIFTPIPFVLEIVTVTKAMMQEDTPLDQPIFPAPPTSPRNLELTLVRHVMFRANNWSNHGYGSINSLGGLSPTPPDDQPLWYEQVQVDAPEKVWLPDLGDEKKNKGSWKQQVTFKSSFTLTCPPAFSSETMSVTYSLGLKVGFPGLGNDLKEELPIVVISSMLPPGAGPWDGPPRELDLPAAYFSATEWDHDEKD